MTNWQKFKIKTVSLPDGTYRNMTDWIFFALDSYYTCSGGEINCFFCVDSYPFNTWQEGNYLEIDLDKIRHYEKRHVFDDTNVIRKFGEIDIRNNSNLPSITRNQTLAIGREIDALIDQSGGRNEYEAKIHVDPDNKVNGYSIVGRRSK